MDNLRSKSLRIKSWLLSGQSLAVNVKALLAQLALVLSIFTQSKTS